MTWQPIDEMTSDKPKRHPQAIAWDEWLASDYGKRACTAYDFTPPGFWQYLENRLSQAFAADWDAYEKHSPPTPDRLAVIKELFSQDISNAEIGRRLSVSRERVRQLRKKPCKENPR